MKKGKHNPETLVVHAGREPSKNDGIVNPPVYHASTIIFDTYDDFVKAEEGRLERPTYGRHGTVSNRLLENALAELEGAEKCLLANSGMNAIAITLSALLKPGDHLLMADCVYSPSRFYAEQELRRIGVEVEFYDPRSTKAITERINENTKLVYIESPGSLTFEVQDIPAIAKVAHENGALVVIDNTWATPFFFKPFVNGVDVSIHSATKYIGGHSDLMMGIINCTEAVYPAIKRTYKNFGIICGPDDIYLAQRGLRTMALRVKHQEQAALEIAAYLKQQPLVAQILHPAFADCQGHEIWKRDYTGSTGLFSFILKKHLSYAEKKKFVESLQFFKMGYSWGGYESLLIPLEAAKIRSAVKWEPQGSGFRIFCGLENLDDLKNDLAGAFAAIS